MIGGLYAWSIISTALIDAYGWSENQLIAPYAIAQFVFACTTMLSGRLVDTKGPRLSMFLGGVLFGTGIMLSSFAKTPAMLNLTFGVLSGVGVGFVYVCPLSTLIKWFPNKKGFITGLSVGMFGAGSIVIKELLEMLLRAYNISTTLLYLGLISGAVIVLASLVVQLPAGYHKLAVQKQQGDYTSKEMVQTSLFYRIWIMYWLAVIPGLLILGAAKNIGLDAGLTPSSAAGLVTILALANAGSRLVSGTLADKFGTMHVLRGAFALTAASLVGISLFAEVATLFYISIIGVAFGYGGFLSLFPVLTNQTFGSFRYGSNYGIVYQAYGIAALSGIAIKSVAGSYTNTFIISAIAAVLGLIIAGLIREPDHTA